MFLRLLNNAIVYPACSTVFSWRGVGEGYTFSTSQMQEERETMWLDRNAPLLWGDSLFDQGKFYTIRNIC